MPHHKSAIKRVRQAPRLLERNRAARSTFRTALKKLDKALVEGKKEDVQVLVQPTLEIIGKTAKKGLIHRNKAARHQSRLAKKLNKLQAEKSA